MLEVVTRCQECAGIWFWEVSIDEAAFVESSGEPTTPIVQRRNYEGKQSMATHHSQYFRGLQTWKAKSTVSTTKRRHTYLRCLVAYTKTCTLHLDTYHSPNSPAPNSWTARKKASGEQKH